jgi:hypothetical protein
MSRIVIVILIYHRHKPTDVMKGLFLNKSYTPPHRHLALPRGLFVIAGRGNLLARRATWFPPLSLSLLTVQVTNHAVSIVATTGAVSAAPKSL